MVFKTLHWYIFRELLRIFVLASSALTILLAFGGTFKPITKQGIDIVQLMTIMLNLMPAMLAYAIPIAALFAAVQVYWRLTTDNELTGCRASGISFVTIIMPALILGIAVACIDLVSVNYVVPIFLKRVEHTVISDLSSLLINQINHKEQVPIGELLVYADNAHLISSHGDTSIVALNQMAAVNIKKGKPTAMVVARQAILTITKTEDGDEAQVAIKLVDAAAFDPQKLSKVSGSIDALNPGGRPNILPSALKSKPKFLNARELYEDHENPTLFRPVRETIDKIDQFARFATINERLLNAWRKTHEAGKPMIFNAPDAAMDTTSQYRVYAPAAEMDENQQLQFIKSATGPVRVEQYVINSAGKSTLQATYTCDQSTLQLADDDFGGTDLSVALQLQDNVMQTDHIRRIAPRPSGNSRFADIVLDDSIKEVPPTPPIKLLASAEASQIPAVRKQGLAASDQIAKLFRQINSEFHSRCSFSLSCLSLVLFGAALGILLKGKNPLAVFVVGFVPAIVLVLLITAGREMAEGSAKGVYTGIGLIWAGNLVIFALIVGVYKRLLSQ